jgi:isopenicillin-N N-acyltransferase-like protein
MNKLRVLQVSGSPGERGYTQGKAFAREIGELTEERLRLSCDPLWTGGLGATLDEVLSLGRACLPYHQEFDGGLMEEMQGMAEATGLGVNELVIMNGFTDFVDIVANPRVRLDPHAAPLASGEDFDDGGCTAFVVAPAATADGRGYLGQTWDMHASATPYVLLLDVRPHDGPALLTFTITGCVGMIGMNEHGVAVGINNLLGADGRPGVHWVYVVRKMLAQPTVDRALAVLSGAHLSGAHNYLLMGPDGRGGLAGYNVEQMASRAHVTPVTTVYAHANHCLIADMLHVERPRKGVSQASTQARYAQATAHLHEQSPRINLSDLMALTRLHEGPLSICAHTHEGYDVESSGACIMSPQTGQMWALWGNPCENEYEEFQFNKVHRNHHAAL